MVSPRSGTLRRTAEYEIVHGGRPPVVAPPAGARYATARGTTSSATACSSTSSIRVFSSGVPIVARTPTPANVAQDDALRLAEGAQRRRAVEHGEPDEVGLRVGHGVAGVAQRRW